MEAELYTKNNSIYDRSFRQPGQGYWAVQHHNWQAVDRVVFGGSPSTGATPILLAYTRGSWVSHHPFAEWSVDPNPTTGEPGTPLGFLYGLADAQANTAPSLEYEFITSADWNSTTSHIWIRAQGGPGWNIDRDELYWAVYPEPGPGSDPFKPGPRVE